MLSLIYTLQTHSTYMCTSPHFGYKNVNKAQSCLPSKINSRNRKTSRGTLLGIARELIKPSFLRKDDHGDFGIAEDRELVSFLQQSGPALREGDLPARCVLNSPHLNFASSHD